MATNPITLLSYANTFGDLVTNENTLSQFYNNFFANNITKDTGTLFLNDPSLGLQVNSSATIQGTLQVQGVGSSGYIQNNLRVDQQVYLTNTSLGLVNSGQANIGGPLYALATANSIIASNNITVGGNTFITGNIYSANNLVIAGTANIAGYTSIYGTTNIANTLWVSTDVNVHGQTRTDTLVANTSTKTATSIVTGLLDVGLGFSQLNLGSANTFTITNGYINYLQSNTKINATFVNAATAYAQTLNTPYANVYGILDASLGNTLINTGTANTLGVTNGYIINLQSNTKINAAFVNAATAYAQSLSTPYANVYGILDVSLGDAKLNTGNANTLSITTGIVANGYIDVLQSNTRINASFVNTTTAYAQTLTTPNAIVTRLLDTTAGDAQLNTGTANTFNTANGYINVLQSNTRINAAVVNSYTLYSQTLTTPTANITGLLNANSATGYFNNLQVINQLSVQGNFVINGVTVYNANTFTINASSSTGQISSYTVNRGSSGANAAIRWNEALSYWDIYDVNNITPTYYRILTTQQINDNLTSTSTVLAASANTANTLNNVITNANNYLQSAVVNAGIFANGAFTKANTNATLIANIQAVDNTQNTNITTTNTLATNAGIFANGAFAAANNVAPQLTPAYNQANAAYNRANTSANSLVGTNGTITPTNGSLTFNATNGFTIVGSGNTFTFSTPQDLRTSATPTFQNLSLSTALPINQGGTGATSSGAALQNILPAATTVGTVLTYGGTGSYYWGAGGGGGGGGATPGTTIQSQRQANTAGSNQTIYNVPTYLPGANQLRVYLNGVRQFPSEYTETSATVVTLTTAPNPNDVVLFEIDGYYVNPYYANNITYGPATGAIPSSANTIQLAIDSIESRKAPIASPSFTGLPTVPTAPITTSNTVIATTAYVNNLANGGYTFTQSITGNAGTVTNGVYTNQTYTNPSWLNIGAAFVGLGNVNNTADVNKSVHDALFAATANTVSWGKVTNTPTTVSGYGITDAITTGNIGSQSVNYATSAGSIAWSGITGTPTTVAGYGITNAITTGNIGSQSVAAATTATTAVTANALNTGNSYQVNSLGVGTPATSVAGEIRATNNITAFYNASDIRLKENLVPLESVLDDLIELSTYYFNYNSRPNQKMIGVMAQDLMKKFPELVYETTPIDEGSGLDKIYAVNYALLSVLVLQGLRDLTKEVRALKGQIK